MSIGIFKVRDVKTPTRGTSKSAGLDFYMPVELGSVVVYPHTDINIPSGIKVRVPEGFAFIAFNKSSVALHKGLRIGARVVDEDYKGEVHIHLINPTDKPVYIHPGEKIIQFILIPVEYEEIELFESEEELFHDLESQRGENGFGHTGKE